MEAEPVWGRKVLLVRSDPVSNLDAVVFAGTRVEGLHRLLYRFDLSNMNAPDLFGAFANPTRLRILNLLQEQKEICVCDLCEVLGEPQPKVSRHLAILRSTGLVEVRSDGKWKFYGLAQPATPLHRTLVRCVRSCLAELDDLAADRERLAALEPRLRCT